MTKNQGSDKMAETKTFKRGEKVYYHSHDDVWVWGFYVMKRNNIATVNTTEFYDALDRKDTFHVSSLVTEAEYKAQIAAPATDDKPVTLDKKHADDISSDDEREYADEPICPHCGSEVRWSENRTGDSTGTYHQDCWNEHDFVSSDAPQTQDKEAHDDEISQPAPASEDGNEDAGSDAHYWTLPHIERIRNDALNQRDTIEQIVVEQDAQIAALTAKLALATAALKNIREGVEGNRGLCMDCDSVALVAESALAQLKKDASQ